MNLPQSQLSNPLPPDSDPDFYDSPILEILDRNPSQLSDEELDAHLNQLSALSTSAHETKAKVTGRAKGPTKKVAVDEQTLKDLLS